MGDLTRKGANTQIPSNFTDAPPKTSIDPILTAR